MKSLIRKINHLAKLDGIDIKEGMDKYMAMPEEEVLKLWDEKEKIKIDVTKDDIFEIFNLDIDTVKDAMALTLDNVADDTLSIDTVGGMINFLIEGAQAAGFTGREAIVFALHSFSVLMSLSGSASRPDNTGQPDS